MLLSLLLTVAVLPDPSGLRAALALEQAGNDAAAIARLGALCRAQPAWEPPHVELGRLALKSGGLDLAELHLDAARALAPEDGNAQYLYGLLMEERQRPAAAVAALRQAVLLSPTNLDARFRLGLGYLELGQPRAAVDAFEGLKALKPDWLAPRLKLAEALAALGDEGRSEQELVLLHEEQPKALSVTRQLVALYERTGRPELAQRLASAATPPAPRKRALKPSRR